MGTTHNDSHLLSARHECAKAEATDFQDGEGWLDRASLAWRTHSITSSARPSSVGGTSRPSARAELMTSSNLLDCTISVLQAVAKCAQRVR